jgi:hypothetical protein
MTTSVEEVEAFRAVELAYKRLADVHHLSPAAALLRIEVARAIAHLKRVIGATPQVRYTTFELQALRAAGFTEEAIWHGTHLQQGQQPYQARRCSGGHRQAD